MNKKHKRNNLIRLAKQIKNTDKIAMLEKQALIKLNAYNDLLNNYRKALGQVESNKFKTLEELNEFLFKMYLTNYLNYVMMTYV